MYINRKCLVFNIPDVVLSLYIYRLNTEKGSFTSDKSLGAFGPPAEKSKSKADVRGV